MDSINETSARECRFLDESYFEELYHAFLYAFSDYVMPFDLSEVQFRNHIVTNAVDLNRSIGCFRRRAACRLHDERFRDVAGRADRL